MLKNLEIIFPLLARDIQAQLAVSTAYANLHLLGLCRLGLSLVLDIQETALESGFYLTSDELESRVIHNKALAWEQFGDRSVPFEDSVLGANTPYGIAYAKMRRNVSVCPMSAAEIEYERLFTV